MITICGRPNVGKSTLTNALVGEKVAIVSNKPQTTRNRILAIVARGETQFVLVDTPGFHKPRTRLGDYMVNVVRESVTDVDCVLLMVEPVAAIGPQEQALIDRLSGDRNRLHSDPEFARSAGFETPILHGLASYGFAGRALLQAVAQARHGCIEFAHRHGQ